MMKFIPATLLSIWTAAITINNTASKSMSDIRELPFEAPSDCNKRIDYDFSVTAMLDHVD